MVTKLKNDNRIHLGIIKKLHFPILFHDAISPSLMMLVLFLSSCQHLLKT